MATHSCTPAQEAQYDGSGGFEFGAVSEGYEIEVSYSWRYVDRIYIDDDGDVVR